MPTQTAFAIVSVTRRGTETVLRQTIASTRSGARQKFRSLWAAGTVGPSLTRFMAARGYRLAEITLTVTPPARGE